MSLNIKKAIFIVILIVLSVILFTQTISPSVEFSVIEFEENDFDFGNIKKNQPVKKYFIYKNIGKSPILISNIQSSCGCTIPNWSKKRMNPNKKDSILILYDSKKVGKFSKSVYVHYNSEIKKPYKITINGFVYKD
jgi:hypothetical protein